MIVAGVAAAALAGRAILRQARGGTGMGGVFQHFTGAGSMGGAQRVRFQIPREPYHRSVLMF